jgi:hypothetical protein
MVMRTRLVVVVLAALLLAVLMLTATACGSSAGNQTESTNPQQDIVGSWSGGGMTLTFASDGKLSYSGTSQSGLKIQGSAASYGFVDSTHIIGVWEADLPTYEVHIRGDSMELTAVDGSTVKFSRK